MSCNSCLNLLIDSEGWGRQVGLDKNCLALTTVTVFELLQGNPRFNLFALLAALYFRLRALRSEATLHCGHELAELRAIAMPAFSPQLEADCADSALPDACYRYQH
jgi:hypothetical protein